MSRVRGAKHLAQPLDRNDATARAKQAPEREQPKVGQSNVKERAENDRAARQNGPMAPQFGEEIEPKR